MLQNLNKHKQQLKEKDELLQNQRAKQPVFQGQIQSEAMGKMQTKITLAIECVAVDSLFIANTKQVIKAEKKKLQQSLFANRHLNHPLFLHYYGISSSKQIKFDFSVQKNDKKQPLEKNTANLNAKEAGNSKTKEIDPKLAKQKKSESPTKLKVQVNQQKVQMQQSSAANIKDKLQDEKQQSKNEIELVVIAQVVEKLNLLKYKSEAKTKQDFRLRISMLKQIAQALSFMHEHQMSFFPNKLQDLLFQTKHSHIKVASHKFKHYKSTTQQELQAIMQKQTTKIKKDVLANRSLKFVSPQFLFKDLGISDLRVNDVWKVGLLIFTVLTGEDFSKELFAMESLAQNKIAQYIVIAPQKLAKIKSFLKDKQKSQLLGSVSSLPHKRISAAQLYEILSQIELNLSEDFSRQVKELAKEFYLKQDQIKLVRFNKELKLSQELITNDHRKKLTEYFKLFQNRILKSYKLVFRASDSKFSSRCFYQAVLQKKCILVVLLQRKEKKKILCYSQQDFNLMKCNGVFGGFVKDSKKLSFIYSPNENEFLRLKNPEKAIGVSMIQGPIFGDGDLVVSDGAIHNTCRFPSSYQSPTNKVKKLFKNDKFQVQQYDVYQLTF